MALLIAPDIRLKLARKSPPVTRQEIIQCFANRTGTFLVDTREKNRTDPPTLWFISETDFGRKLKICFIEDVNDITIKTAYEPSDIEKDLYARKGQLEDHDESEDNCQNSTAED